MREISPFEGGGGRSAMMNGRFCIGRVISVDPIVRRCRVKTIGLVGVTDDLDLYDVRFLTLANHGEGDEGLYIPRPNCLVVVTFINTEPYIVGYWQSIATDSDLPPSDKEKLLPGDYIFKTKAGNRLILRSGGSIELESTKMCRIWLLPSRNAISALMNNLELATQGGRINWGADDDSDNTHFKLLLFDTITANNVVEVSAGKNPDGSLLSVAAGPGGSGNSPSENRFFFSVMPDGSAKLDVGGGKATLSISADGTVNLTHTGALSIKTGGSANIEVGGNATVKAKKVTLTAEGNEVPGKLVTDNEINADPITGVPLIGHLNIDVP